MNIEQLQQEVDRLRRKLSPLEDKEFTKKLALLLAGKNLLKFKKKFRRGTYIVVTPRDIADLCGLPADMPVLTNIGRSLQAMCWERSAKNGSLVFVMPIEEYESGLV
jgi:hypothetical protein